MAPSLHCVPAATGITALLPLREKDFPPFKQVRPPPADPDVLPVDPELLPVDPEEPPDGAAAEGDGVPEA